MMDKQDKIYAEKVLKHLFIGAQVDGIKFDITPSTIKIYFTNSGGSSGLDDYVRELFLNIESKWCLFHHPPEKYPSNEEEMGEYPKEEGSIRIVKIRRQKVVDIKLGNKTPHLFITLGNGDTIFVNGSNDQYECWQAGVQFDEDDWLVVAIPGDVIAAWAPEKFNAK